MAASKTVSALGLNVTYRDRYGRVKAARILATHQSMNGAPDVNTHLNAPAPGHAHIVVESFTGSRYMRFNVPAGDGPSTLTAPAGTQEELYPNLAGDAQEKYAPQAAEPQATDDFDPGTPDAGGA
jgi:hypothetical protein